MNDEILKKLEARLDRRSFLRGSELGVAALLGVAAASPLIAFAQDSGHGPQGKQKDEPAPKKDKAPDPRAENPDTVEDDGPAPKVTKSRRRRQRDTASARSAGNSMYRQGRTWTCENCGYSYIE